MAMTFAAIATSVAMTLATTTTMAMALAAPMRSVMRPAALWRGTRDELLGEHFRSDRSRWDFVSHIAFDFRQRHSELLTREADRVAFRAGPGCAAYAMNIIRGILWQVEVEDVADIGNVQSA